MAALDRSIFKLMLAAAPPDAGEQESLAGSESLWTHASLD